MGENILFRPFYFSSDGHNTISTIDLFPVRSSLVSTTRSLIE